MVPTEENISIMCHTGSSLHRPWGENEGVTYLRLWLTELNLFSSSPCLPGSSALTLQFPSWSCTGVACIVPVNHHLTSPFFPLSEFPQVV